METKHDRQVWHQEMDEIERLIKRINELDAEIQAIEAKIAANNRLLDQHKVILSSIGEPDIDEKPDSELDDIEMCCRYKW